MVVRMEKVKVFVNLERKEATIQVIRRVKLFENPGKRFIVESDDGGFSCIELRDGKYYFVNYLRDRSPTGEWIHGSEKPIEKRQLMEKEVKEIIRKTLMFPSGYT
jgi:hypothetical protein